MEYQYDLRDEQWDRIKDELPGKLSDKGRTAKDNRRFIAAIRYKAKTGCDWRSLPKEYGKWNSIARRFSRWAKKGVWQKIFNTIAVSPDTEWLMLDSTIVRVHQHASGAKGSKKNKKK